MCECERKREGHRAKARQNDVDDKHTVVMIRDEMISYFAVLSRIQSQSTEQGWFAQNVSSD